MDRATISRDGLGVIVEDCSVTFSGDGAGVHAREYAAWVNAGRPMGGALPPPLTPEERAAISELQEIAIGG